MRRFCNIFEEQSQEFYREKRNKLKKKVSIREKMLALQNTIFKQQIKIAFLYEVVHNKSNAHDNFKLAYNGIINILPSLFKSYEIWEVKAVADTLMIKEALYYLSTNEAKQVVSLFCNHYQLFKLKTTDMDQKQAYLEYKWRATQLRQQASFLQNDVSHTDPISKKEVTMWLSFLNFVPNSFTDTTKTRLVPKC